MASGPFRGHRRGAGTLFQPARPASSLNLIFQMQTGILRPKVLES
jgi:hypothetical protein